MSSRTEPAIEIEVVFALPDDQSLLRLTVPSGTTAGEAVALSGLAQRYPANWPDRPDLSLFSRLIDADRVLESGDRVEVLRPLKADPKEVRRALAAQGKTMGRGAGKAARQAPASSIRATESPSK